MHVLAVLLPSLLACGESPPSAPPPAPEATPEEPASPGADALPDVPMSDVSGERALLGKGVPPAGTVTHAMEALAARVGAGVVRCPLAGGGRGEVVRGRASDHATAWGIPIEAEDAEAPGWSPALDVAASDAEWVTFLAAPGDTRTTVTTRSRSLRYEHPAAVAGTTVTCTAVHPGGARVVRGRIPGERPEGLVVMPCLAPPPPIGKDGTFAALVPTPCRMWVEGGAQKSEQLEIEAGNGPLELTFHLAPDPMQADGKLTAEARARLLAYVDGARARDVAANEAVNAVRATFAGDAGVEAVLNVVSTALHDRTILGTRAKTALESMP